MTGCTMQSCDLEYPQSISMDAWERTQPGASHVYAVLRLKELWAISSEKSAKVRSRVDLVKWEDRGGSSLHPGIWSLLGQT